MKLWLIVAYLLFAQQVYNRKQQKHCGHVAYVIEQIDQFQNLVKPWHKNMNFKKSDLNKKNVFFYFLNIMIFSNPAMYRPELAKSGYKTLYVPLRK